VLVVCWNSWLC